MKALKFTLNGLIVGLFIWILYMIFSIRPKSIRVNHVVEFILLFEVLIGLISLRIGISQNKPNYFLLSLFISLVLTAALTLFETIDLINGIAFSTSILIIVVAQSLSVYFKNYITTGLSYLTALLFVLAIFIQPNSFIFYTISKVILIALSLHSIYLLLSKKAN